MPATPIRSVRLPQDPPPRHAPLLSTVVVASYKGGVGKTALTVALAERLAWAGLRVLLLTCDSQEDARHRLGVPATDPLIARRAYGTEGSVTVAGIRGAKAVDLLYRLGPEQLGLGTFDIAVVDTPPEAQGGSLPGVLLLTPVDGTDAARNLLTMLRRTPENTEIMLIHVGRTDPDEWMFNAAAVEQALGRSLHYLEDPLPKARSIKHANRHPQGARFRPFRQPHGATLSPGSWGQSRGGGARFRQGHGATLSPGSWGQVKGSA